MGNTESQEDFDEFAKFEGIDTLGYRVLGVQPNSPASEAGLVSFFDFLVGANGKILLASGEGLEEGEEYDDVDFPALCQGFLNKPLELLVWNIKCQEKRLVTITPSDSWGGAGLLGVTIRLDDYGGADERLIRVLEVEPSSPAAICGLVENHDYLLGTTADSFDSVSTLAQVLQQHVDKVVEVYVYNTDSDVVRVVALMPTYSWGGNGLLGAEVGTGYLHRLPMSSRDTIGSSVERKVRWVGMKPVRPAEQQQQNEAQEPTLEVEPQLEMEVVDSSHEETHKTVQQVADHGGNGQSNNAPPMMHPQAGERSGGSAAPPVQETAKTAEPSSEGESKERNVSPEPETAAASSSEPTAGEASKAEEPVPPPPPPPAPEVAPVPAPEVAQVNDEQVTHQSQQEAEPSAQEAQAMTMPPPPQQQAEPSAQETTTVPPPPPPVDAAALFAAPPPDVPTASYASQFMPPPPMSHVTREK